MSLRVLARELLVALLFLTATLALTWPLAVNLDAAVADPGDSYNSISILNWNWWAMTHQPTKLFDLPVFYPSRLALAFTENLFGITLVSGPLQALGLPVLTAYNLTLILGFAFAGYSAYVLGRMITGCTAAGVLAGLFYAFLPQRFTHVGHIGYLWSGWLALMLAALLFYDRKPGWHRAVIFGAFFLMNALAWLHWLVFGSVATGLTVLVLMVRKPDRRLSYAVPLIVVTAISALLLLPFGFPYVQVREMYGMTRTIADLEHFSARWRDWLVPSLHIRYSDFLNDGSVGPERWLFPGFTPIVLAGVWLFMFVFRRGDAERCPGPIISLAWIVVGVLGSLGVHFFFHSLLFDSVPPFQSIRVPARWAMIAYVGLSMLVAAGSSRLLAPLDTVRRLIGASFIAAILLYELNPAPVRWYLTPSATREVYLWLRDVPGDGAVLELPMGQQGRDYEALLAQTIHGKPLINGASSFHPPHYGPLIEMSRASPIPDGFLTRIEGMECSWIVVHADDQTGESTRQWLDAGLRSGRLTLLGLFPPPVSVFAVTANGPEHSPVIARALTWGTLQSPRDSQDLRGPIEFHGSASSPFGIRSIALRFNNGGVTVPVPLSSSVRSLKFRVRFRDRPWWARHRMDVQLELRDGAGKRSRMKPVLFQWRERTDIRWYEWDSAALAGLLDRMGHAEALARKGRPQYSVDSEEIVKAILRSSRGQTDREFVRNVYRTLFSREPDVMSLAGVPRRRYVHALIASDEFQRRYVRAFP